MLATIFKQRDLGSLTPATHVAVLDRADDNSTRVARMRVHSFVTNLADGVRVRAAPLRLQLESGTDLHAQRSALSV